MPYSAVQKDFYVFSRDGVMYVQFRDPVTRKLLSKKSSGLRSKTKAEKWAQQEFERRCGEVGKKDITFREYAEQFYTDGCPHEAERKANGQTFGVKTKEGYRSRLTNYIFPDPICDKRLCDITRPDCLDLRDRLIKKLGYTRKAQLTIVTYRNIINTALNRGLINIDPAVRVTIKVKNKGKRTATSVDNVKNIMLKKYWPNKTLWLAAMTAGLAGLRAGELCGILWQDIDLEDGIIKIVRSMNYQEGEKPPKSGKPRIAPYPKLLQAILEPHRGNPDAHVFSIRKGQHLSYNTLRSAMDKAVAKAMADGKKDKASIPKITLHGLRHSINTALLEAGVNPELLRASFGWVDEETQEIYTHRDLYNLAPQREATDKLFEDFLGE